MSVDVLTEIEIVRPRAEVAGYAADPDNATAWYENIKAVEWLSLPPLAVGTRLAFAAQFLGRRLSYTYEVAQLVPGERLAMRTSEGPFPMETTYAWADCGPATRMTLRNRGEPAGFRKADGTDRRGGDAPRQPQGPRTAEGHPGEARHRAPRRGRTAFARILGGLPGQRVCRRFTGV